MHQRHNDQYLPLFASPPVSLCLHMYVTAFVYILKHFSFMKEFETRSIRAQF